MIFGVRYAKNCLHRQWNSLIFPEIDLFCQNGRCCFDRHAKTRSGLCAFFALRYVPRFPEKARRLSRSADVLPYCGEKPVRNKTFRHRLLRRGCCSAEKVCPAFPGTGMIPYGSEKEFPFAAWPEYLPCAGTVGIRRNPECKRPHWIFIKRSPRQGKANKKRW